MIYCRHNQGKRATITIGVIKTDLYGCDKFGICTQSQTAGLKHQTCENCPAWEAADYLTCRHRGEPTGETLNCGCEIDRNFYGCSIKGKCLKRLPSGGNARQKYANELTDVTVCMVCDSVPQPHAATAQSLHPGSPQISHPTETDITCWKPLFERSYAISPRLLLWFHRPDSMSAISSR